MPKSIFSWLHLTDLHYGLKGQGHLWPTLREPFLESLAALHEKCGPWDAVLFTGDLVQSGESAQFERMQAEVLDPLWARLSELGSGGAVLLAVPGNHDLYRPNPLEDNAAIDVLLEKGGFQRSEEKFWERPAGPYRRVINEAFAAYSQWWGTAPQRPAALETGVLPGDFAATIPCDGRRIGIVGMNTTFLQLAGGDYKGRLVWDPRQLHALCDGGVDVWSKQHDVCLLLTHQGPDWLTPEARQDGESEISPTGRFAVHLFGHQHETEITYVRRGGSLKATRLCQGCSVFGMERFGDPPVSERAHGYSAGRVDLGDEETALRLWPRIATSNTGPWRFVPDHEHAELEGDEGTAPESIVARTRVGRTKPAGAVAIGSVPVEIRALQSAPIVPHSTLPARRPFFGRTKELETVAKYLLPENRSWGVVLDGPGGMGKTALALEAAHRAPAEHFPLKLWITAKNRELLPDGEHQLNDHRVDDFYAMLNELGRALGRDDIPRAVPEERPGLVRHALASHRVLLVLDNLETFRPEERRRLFELMGNLPASCRAIITSRRRTDGSTAALHLRLDKLERDAADDLLAELGTRLEPVSHLTQEERDRLYSETGGNPLLLTWTAGQLGRTTGRCRTVDEAIERLREADRLQKQDARNDPLAFIFGDFAETFTADETAVLAALVHFTRPAPLKWLMPLTCLSPKAAEIALDGLRDRALLVEDDKAATWLLPPLASRFLRRVRPEAVEVSGERLADQVYALAAENGYQEFDRFPILEDAWPQIAAALPVLISGENGRVQAACKALRNFLEFSGRWDDWLSLNTEAEAGAERAKDFDQAGWRAVDAGYCYCLRGQSTEALACADRAAEYWNASRAGARERALVICLRGLAQLTAEDYLASITAFRAGLELFRSLAPRSEEVANTLNYLGAALRGAGQFDEAEVHYRHSLEFRTASRDWEGVAIVIANLAELAVDRGKWKEAEILARDALQRGEAIGRKELIAGTEYVLAKALARLGRSAEGQRYAERAVATFTELRSPKVAEAQASLNECLGVMG